MGTPSSLDMHPAEGARFVFERLDPALSSDSADQLNYAVAVFLADGRLLEGELSWRADGRPELRARPESEWGDAWATEETLKLARVLRRTPRQRMIRWRG